MPLIEQTFNNFVRGKIDRGLNARDDIAVFNNGAPLFRNIFTNLKGNALFRNGYSFVDNLGEDAVQIEFQFNETQQYVMFFTETTIHFYTFASDGTLGVLLSGSTPVTISNPWTLDEARGIDFAQNGDTMYLVSAQRVRKLIRTTATSFSLNTYTTTGETFGSTGLGWPTAVEFHESRLFYSGFTEAPITIIGSEAGAFDNLDSSVTPDDSTALKLVIADTKSPIKWLKSGENSLIAGTDEGNVAINGGQNSASITTASVEAKLTSTTGASGSQPVLADGNLFYIDRSKRKVKFFSFDVLTESFKAVDANFLSFEVTKPSIEKMRFFNTDTPLIFSRRIDGQMVAMFFNEDENVISWQEFVTDGEVRDFSIVSRPNGDDVLVLLVKRNDKFLIERMDFPQQFPIRNDFNTVSFTNGDPSKDDEAYLRSFWEAIKGSNHLDSSVRVQDLRTVQITFDGTDKITAASSTFASADVGDFIVYKTKTGYESGVFEITQFNSSTEVLVNVLQTPTDLVYDEWYKTLTAVTSGLTWLEGLTVKVAADGGDIGEFVVTDGGVDFGVPATSVIIGLPYAGEIGLMTLGTRAEEINTQWHDKKVNRLGLRFVDSAGVLVGTERNGLEEVQSLPTVAPNYLPPPPLNGTTIVDITDSPSVDRSLFVVQNKPLPMTLTGIYAEVDHEPSS